TKDAPSIASVSCHNRVRYALRPQTVDHLSDLAEGNVSDAKTELFQFLMAMYNPARRFETLTECRRALFASSSTRSLDAIPPTEDAALLHFLRASYRAQP
ncbi:FAD-binding monooxygenase VdtE, partial [Frankliniella fusca]